MKGSNVPCRGFFLVLLLAYVKLSSCSGDVEPEIVEEWAENIGAKIHDFAVRVTGSTAIEKELAKLSFKAEVHNGTKLVKDVSEKMQHFFDKKIKSLRNVVAKAEEVHRSYTYDDDIEPFRYMDMKNYKSSDYNLTFASAFNINVTFTESGVQVPTEIYDEAPEILNTIKWSEALDEVFINNSKTDPDLKWQFFGSETGVFRSYPAKQWELGPKNIDLYDARKRPWYIHGSTSPKTVVVIVDSSGSMYGRPMLIARLAVRELIDTLSENDFFNILWFNKDVYYLACEKKFVQATPQNKQFYKNKLKEIEAGYVAAWSKAYEAAFKVFQGDVGANCQKVIMVFTDGPTERSSGVFESYNKDKQVRVFTYAVGPPAHSIEALRAIACGNKGYFYRIPGVESVRDVVKGYVSVLSRPMAENNTYDPIWSSVYVDASGLGMMITGTLPIFLKPNQTGVSRILGVTGTDVPLDDINRLFDQALLGADGYFFLINNNGHIVKHPALQTTLGYLEDPPGIYVSDIEFGWKVNSTEPTKLRKKMLEIPQGQVDTMVFDVAKFSNDEFRRRVKKRTMTYFFTTIKDTPLRFGIATPKLLYKIVSDPGNLGVNETIIGFLTKYWENQTISGDTVEVFVETYVGTFEMSRSKSEFKPEQDIRGRIDQYPDDITVLSVPYNSGKNNVMNSRITGYRKVRANASGTSLNLAVVGFNVEHTRFHDDYFISMSTKDSSHSCNRKNLNEYEGYYCYLLDENAFIVGANADSEMTTGQFFGKVDNEIMKQLVKGDDSLLPHPIYEKVVKHDYQGSCKETSDTSFNSAPFLQPFFSMTSYVKWCTTKVVWFIAQLNLYNWLFSESTSVSADSTEITKSRNRSCIMSITAYYANVTDTNITQQGKAYCVVNCFDNSSQCQRSFVVSKVPKTNLFLLVVNASLGRCATTRVDPINGIPGEPVEVVRNKEDQEQSVCYKDPYRKRIARCYTSDNPETNYPCGSCTSNSVSLVVFISTLLMCSFIW